MVIFLADDEGYGELGAQGNTEIPTPNIDSLAKNGTRFTEAMLLRRIAVLVVQG